MTGINPLILVVTYVALQSCDANYMDKVRAWFEDRDNDDWNYLDSNLDWILASAGSEVERDLYTLWHEACNPAFSLCESDSDCAFDESCTNWECLPNVDAFDYGFYCTEDSHCSGDLVCCDDYQCCHLSERDRYDELPCEWDDDCCSGGDLDSCCKWEEGVSYGTCCSFDQYIEQFTDCSHQSCANRMVCCPADDFTWLSNDYCCTLSEYEFVMGITEAESCDNDNDCFSESCCGNGLCCTYGAFVSENSVCNTDSQCYGSQFCCENNRCCYEEDDPADTWLLILLIAGVFIGALLIAALVTIVACVMCSKSKPGMSRAAQANATYPGTYPTYPGIYPTAQNPSNVAFYNTQQGGGYNAYQQPPPQQHGWVEPPQPGQLQSPSYTQPGAVPAAPSYNTPMAQTQTFVN